MEFIYILYKPAVSGNIGAAARAIKTMGFDRLRLIDPCDHLSEEARKFAHGSVEILESAEVYNNFEDCTRDIDFLIGTTAKKRSAKEDYHPPGELLRYIQGKKDSINFTGIIFGTEESGLPNEILLKCDVASSIPIRNPYPSLNLGQAVMLYAYEFSTVEQDNQGIQIKRKESYSELKKRTASLLEIIGIPENMPLFGRIMERLSALEDQDINLVHSVTSRIIRYIGNNTEKDD